MKKLLIILLTIIFCSCKSQFSNKSLVQNIYNAPYDRQATLTYDFLKTEKSAKKLGLVFISVYHSDSNDDFQDFASINATLVNKNDIWKVKMIRFEIINNKREEVHYLAYIRRKDGALLYTIRETGEWIGSTDVEEMKKTKD